MPATRVGVREFRERMADYLESDSPVAVTRHGQTLGIYVPARRRRKDAASVSELRAAADRLAEALADIDEDQLIEEFSQARRAGRKAKPARRK
jgi:antitoxin (DNA-binding transcriptional repressor) of toxin-antitoxin stability system